MKSAKEWIFDGRGVWNNSQNFLAWIESIQADSQAHGEAIGRVKGLQQAAAQDRGMGKIHSNPDLANLCEDCASDHEWIIANTPELKAEADCLEAELKGKAAKTPGSVKAAG